MPDNWVLYESSVYYVYMDNSNDSQKIEFSYWDFHRYKRFYNNLAKNKKKKERLKRTQTVLIDVREELMKQQSKIDKEVADAVAANNEILRQLDV